MTEAQWLASEDPGAMLEWATLVLPGYEPHTGTPNRLAAPGVRKLRLFADACRHSFFHGHMVRAGSWSGWESDAHMDARHRDERLPALRAAQCWAAELALAERPRRAGFLREIVGNPFRADHVHLPFHKRATLLTPIVLSLAQAACNALLPCLSLDPARLAVLSDALEEAGCDNDDILSHLRSPGPHVRGCWALDLVLGRE